MSDDAPDGTAPRRPLTLAEAFERDRERHGGDPSPVRRPRRRRGRSYDPAQRRMIGVLAATTAVVGALSGASPTGWAPADAVWTGAFAALVCLACVPAKRWTWLVLAGAAAALGGGPWQLVGIAALLGALLAAWRDARAPVLGALVGGLAVQALLRLDDLGPDGTTALVAGLVVLPAFVSGRKHARSSVRRRVRLGAAAVAAVCLLAVLGFAAGVALGQSDARAAQEDARDGLRALRDGEQEMAASRLHAASDGFTDARSAFSGPWALPARAVPLVGHQAAALDNLAEQGAAVTDSGAEGARSADYERLRPVDGRVDLVALQEIQRPLDDIVASLDGAEASATDLSTHWLAPPLRSLVDDFYGDVDEALPEAELAAEAVHVAPGLLGADGPRRYLLAFAQPAEARYMGGFIGSYGFLTADAGKVSLERSGPISELSNAPGADERTISGPPEFLDRYGRFNAQRFLQNLTATPDLPTLATVADELVPQTGAGEIDGVLYVDPIGIAALLEITGPVQVEGLEEPLTADNAVELLLRRQYQLFPDIPSEGGDEAQEGFLGRAADATFDALLGQRLPSPRRLADSVGSVARGNHLMASVDDPRAQAFFERVGAAGAFPAEQGADWLSVRHTNVNPNKTDAYLEREVAYDVVTDPSTGEVTATATVTLTNRAPAGPTEGLTESVQAVLGNRNGDPVGTNRMQLAVFTPLDLTAARLDDAAAAVETQSEFGGRVYGFTIAVPPGGTRVLELDLRGGIDPGPYHLWLSQPGLTRPDQVSITVRSTDGPVTDATGLRVQDGVASRSGTLAEDLEVTVG